MIEPFIVIHYLTGWGVWSLFAVWFYLTINQVMSLKSITFERYDNYDQYLNTLMVLMLIRLWLCAWFTEQLPLKWDYIFLSIFLIISYLWESAIISTAMYILPTTTNSHTLLLRDDKHNPMVLTSKSRSMSN